MENREFDGLCQRHPSDTDAHELQSEHRASFRRRDVTRPCRIGEDYIRSQQQTCWGYNPGKNAPQFFHLTLLVLQDVSAHFVFSKSCKQTMTRSSQIFFFFPQIFLLPCCSELCSITHLHLHVSNLSDFCDSCFFHCNIFMTVSPAHYQTALCKPSGVFSMSDVESQAYYFSLNIFCKTLI